MGEFLTPQGIEAAEKMGFLTVLLGLTLFGLWWVFKDERVAGRTKQILLEANERLAEEVREMRAEIRTLHVQLAESETARTNDRMELETRLEHIKDDLAEARSRAEAMEAQNEVVKAQLDEALKQLDETLKRLAEAERQRDAIAAKAHQEKQQLEATIQQLQAEVEQLRQRMDQPN